MDKEVCYRGDDGGDKMRVDVDRLIVEVAQALKATEDRAGDWAISRTDEGVVSVPRWYLTGMKKTSRRVI